MGGFGVFSLDVQEEAREGGHAAYEDGAAVFDHSRGLGVREVGDGMGWGRGRRETYVQMPTLVMSQVRSGSVSSGTRKTTPAMAMAQVLDGMLVWFRCGVRRAVQDSHAKDSRDADLALQGQLEPPDGP